VPRALQSRRTSVLRCMARLSLLNFFAIHLFQVSEHYDAIHQISRELDATLGKFNFTVYGPIHICFVHLTHVPSIVFSYIYF
jgi:hypothetical protein